MKSVLFILILSVNLHAQVVISEILYNEPEGRANLEWIELYNRADTAVDLHNFILVVGIDTTRLTQNSYVGPSKYMIFARQLVSSTGDSFEGHWGDSSWTWGDSPQENYPAFDTDFSLPNTSGLASLYDSNYFLRDNIAWNSAAGDGQSLERDDLSDPNSEWHICTNPAGSTPGKANSSSTQSFSDIALSANPEIIFLSGHGGQQMEIVYSSKAGNTINITIFDDSGYRVRKLLESSGKLAGSVIWDGCSDNGKTLAPGIYLIQLFQNGGQNKTKTLPVVIAP